MLETATISDGVESLGDMAFYYCEELKEIVLPDSIKNIGEKIFGQCHKLRKVTLSKTFPVLQRACLWDAITLKKLQYRKELQV